MDRQARRVESAPQVLFQTILSGGHWDEPFRYARLAAYDSLADAIRIAIKEIEASRADALGPAV